MNNSDNTNKNYWKKGLWIIGLLVVAASLAAWYSAKNKTKSKTDENVFKVKRGDLLVSVSVTGTIQPLETVEVKSKASGKIIKMKIDQGDDLKEGTLIAEIEKTFTQPDVDQGEADLRAAKARLEQAKINIELQVKQSETDIASKQEAVKTAQLQLEKLQIDIANEKDANARDLQNAQNNLNIAKLQESKIKIGSRPEEVKRAEATLTQAKSNLELNQTQYERLKKLGEQGYVSKEDMDTARAKYEDAKAQDESAAQNLELVKNPTTKEDKELAQLQVKQAEFALQAANDKIKAELNRDKDVEVAQAHVRDTQTDLDMVLMNKAQIELKKKDLEATAAQEVHSQVTLNAAQDRLKDTLVTAPITGTILQKYVEEGQIIASGISAVSGGTTLVTMADLNKVCIKANVDETDIGKVLAEQSVKIAVDAFPKEKFKGKIIRIAPQGVVVQNVTTFEVTVEIENLRSLLKPGMNVSLDIVAAEKKNILYVPNDAVKEKHDKKTVEVIKDGQTVAREVQTGISNWEFTEITAGLAEDEAVNSKPAKKETHSNNNTTPRPPSLFGGR